MSQGAKLHRLDRPLDSQKSELLPFDRTSIFYEYSLYCILCIYFTLYFLLRLQAKLALRYIVGGQHVAHMTVCEILY